MTIPNTELSRKELKDWFVAHAKAPIDPWYMEFAWSVWQAAGADVVEDMRKIKKTLEHAGIVCARHGEIDSCFIVNDTLTLISRKYLGE